VVLGEVHNTNNPLFGTPGLLNGDNIAWLSNHICFMGTSIFDYFLGRAAVRLA